MQTFLKPFKLLKPSSKKMPCGYCSGIGHTMRNCNSTAAQRLLYDYRRECLLPRTDLELNRFLRSFTGDMLSVIMYSYGASSVSVNRASKEQFIREQILQARAQSALVIDLTAQPIHNQAQSRPRTPVGLPPAPVLIQPAILQQPAMVAVHQQQNVAARERRAAYKARMQIAADTLFDVICVTAYGITQYTDDNAFEFRQMINLLSECLIAQTGNSVSDSRFISNLISKKFHLRRGIAPVIKCWFFRSINAENRRVIETVTETRIALLRAQGILPSAPINVPRVFIPHIPKFVDIQLVQNDASEADDYCCGICADELKKETLPTLGCNHTLCLECITGQIKARTKSCIRCPYCREEVTQISVGDQEVRNQIRTLVVAEIAKN